MPTTEPLEVVAGDTLKWTIYDSEYVPSDGWSLVYYIANAVAQHGPFTSTPDGEDHLLEIAAATTNAWAAGTYRFNGHFAKGTERYLARVGTIVVNPDLADGATETRSHARKVLAAIEAVLETRATRDQAAYSVEGRSLSRTPVPELLQLRDRYRAEVRAEERRDAISRGETPRKGRVIARFPTP